MFCRDMAYTKFDIFTSQYLGRGWRFYMTLHDSLTSGWIAMFVLCCNWAAYYTVHTARILQSPPDPAIFHDRGQPLSVTALSRQSALCRLYLLPSLTPNYWFCTYSMAKHMFSDFMMQFSLALVMSVCFQGYLNWTHISK